MDATQDFEEVQMGHFIVNLSRLLASRVDRTLEEIGLYRGQAVLLMILSHHDGLTHSEIAEKLTISSAAATKVIKRMEALNYIQRRSDPNDGRVSRVFLRDEGRAVDDKIKSIFRQNEELLRNGLSEEEQAILVNLLARVHANLLASAC